MLRPALVDVPVHARCRLVVHVHPVHPHVAPPRLRVLREHQRQRDERPPVPGPGLDDGQERKRRPLPLHHFLAGRRRNGLREKVRKPRQAGKHLELLQEVGGDLRLQDLGDPRADVVEPRNPQREAHPLHRPEEVHGERHGAPFHVREQQRRAPGFDRTVCDFRRLELRGNLHGDFFQVSSRLEGGEERRQVAERHRDPSECA